MTQRKRFLAQVWPMGLLCLIVASRWLLDDAMPQLRDSLLSQSVGYSLSGILLLIPSLIRRSETAERPSESWSGRVCISFVFVGPVIASIVAGRNLGANGTTLALAMTPVALALSTTISNEKNDGNLTARMAPGFAGLAGLLLLLPRPEYSNWRSWAALSLMPIAGAIGAGSWFVRGGPRERLWDSRSAGIGLLLAGLFCYGCRFIQPRPPRFSLSTYFPDIVIDGVTAILSVSILSRLGPLRWSSQFLLVPLVSFAEGMLFVRPFFDFRLVLGLALIASGFMYQFFFTSEGETAPEALSLHLEHRGT